jgi:4'-phosphopantetheinyl transferase EntD
VRAPVNVSTTGPCHGINILGYTRQPSCIIGASRQGRAGPRGAAETGPLPTAVLASLLGPGFAVATAVPKRVDDALFPEELRFLAQAVDRRRAEFGTARVCARRALAELGIAPCPLVPYPDRSPRWPAGVVGSISHTENCCAVAVTTDPSILSFGLDIEQDRPLPPGLEPLICTAAERAWLDTKSSACRAWLAGLFFAAKEAFYKCQFGATGSLIDFQEVALALNLDEDSFAVATIARHGPQWQRVHAVSGRLRRAGGLIVAVATLSD